jgi:hypothetical protein
VTGQYDDIEEVQAGPVQLANQFMDHGYVLLAIHPITSLRTDNSGNSYIQQGVTFIVGRPHGVVKYTIPRGNGSRD